MFIDESGKLVYVEPEEEDGEEGEGGNAKGGEVAAGLEEEESGLEEKEVETTQRQGFSRLILGVDSVDRDEREP